MKLLKKTRFLSCNTCFFKKTLLPLTATALILTSCGGNPAQPNAPATTSAPTTQAEVETTANPDAQPNVDAQLEANTETPEDAPENTSTLTPYNSSAKIIEMLNEQIGESSAEILMISYDENQPWLEEYGYKNPEIDSFNNAINFGIRQRYEEFIATETDREWVDIRSFPFESSDYLQIVTVYNIYPTYGTDGEIYSYNFDSKNNKFLSLIDVMQELNLTEESVSERVHELYVPELPSFSVGDIKFAGFLMKDSNQVQHTQILLEIVIENSEAEPWKRFFSYNVDLDELTQLDKEILFP